MRRREASAVSVMRNAQRGGEDNLIGGTTRLMRIRERQKNFASRNDREISTCEGYERK